VEEAVEEVGGGGRVGAGERVLREEDVARVEAEQRGRVGLERGAGQPHHAERQRVVLLLLLRRRSRGRRLHAAGVGRRHRRRWGALGVEIWTRLRFGSPRARGSRAEPSRTDENRRLRFGRRQITTEISIRRVEKFKSL